MWNGGRRKKAAWMLAAVFVTAGILTGAFFAFRTEGGPPSIQASESAPASPAQNRQIILSMGESPETMTVSWKGSSEGPACFRFGSSKEDLSAETVMEAERKKALQGRYYRYTVTLENLQQGQTCYYQIGDGVTFDPPKSFTVPDETGETTFLYLGDVQYDVSLVEYQQWGTMTADICEENPDIDFAVIGGDMVNSPSKAAQWNSFLDNCGVFSQIPLMTVSGNHEGVSSNRTYRKLFAMPQNGPDDEELREDFYYFDYGSCRFVMLDSSFLTADRKEKLGAARWNACEKQIETWLTEVLERNTRSWIVVVVHHPPYGLHDNATVSPELRKRWTPIMRKGGVDLVLCGHQHMYLRTCKIGGITYVMGNSGTRVSEFYNGYNAPLYSRSVYEGATYQIITATDAELRLVCRTQKGLVIDETTLKKGLRFHILEFLSSGQIVV